MKRVLTLREKAILNNGFFGIVWIVMGFMNIFKQNLTFKLLAVIFLLIGVVPMLIPYFIKSESEDEMSEYNKNRARSITYTILLLAISICTLIATIKDIWVVDLKTILPFVVGGANLIEFLLFASFERVGAYDAKFKD